jgi:hypothetical protein
MGKKSNVNAGTLMIRGKNKGRTFRSDFILPCGETCRELFVAAD